MKYTAGELANKLGVSARTVRFYDEKKILLPCEYSEGGYRLYDDESAQRLQKILMLRFLDFSIEQIKIIMQDHDQKEKFDVRKSLEEQEEILFKKKEHIERILQAVKKARTAKDEQLWEELVEIIHITKKREDIIEQYQNDDNLNKRITIHDYSTSNEGFYSWMLHQVDLKEGMKILEIGCGNAAFWKNVAHDLPNGLEVHLTDYSLGMLNSAEKVTKEIQTAYPQKNLKFILEKRDATDFSYPVDGFDRIMANHVLFYLSKENRCKLYEKLQQLLAPDGRFSFSLIGQKHMHELHQLVRKYYPEVHITSDSFDFWLETAPEEVKDYFPKVWAVEQENDLLVPDPEVVFNYVCSYSDDVKYIMENDRENFIRLIREHMSEEGNFFIHKSTGIVLCQNV